MHASISHLADFQLAQRCLDGSEAALTVLQGRLSGPVRAFVQGAGGDPQTAGEIAEDLFADCLTGAEGRSGLLTKYNGGCALATWLNTVALNRLISRKRRDERWNRLIPQRLNPTDAPEDDRALITAAVSGPEADAPLLEIMRDAIQAAFDNCPAEHFVMLRLAHCEDLNLLEIARMFGCSQATVSRQLERARAEIARSTHQRVRDSDPWIDLKWEDFLELCGSATPG